MVTSITLQALACASVLAYVSAQNNDLPVVDLGYQLQRASSYFEAQEESQTSYYNFSNIRFAAPPTGELRWRAPQAPAVNRDVIDDGNSIERVCPQANPGWQVLIPNFLVDYLSGQNFTPPANTTFSPPPKDPRETEDCLFLDVFTPKEVFEQAGKGYGAPVLVWVYGGGYTAGTKAASGSPSGLLDRSFTAPTTDGVIYVAMNYRLGVYGWASGPTIQTDGVANAGLLDQRFALEWVQQNIAKFGGDPNRVTVFGESAGGGSIMHQITAYGGMKGPVPFQQAVPQSPGWFPVVSTYAQETTFQNFLRHAGVSSLEDARQLDEETLYKANQQQVGLDSPYGLFTYGPVVDGEFVPALPGQLLSYGQFDQSLRVMVGYNGDEGLLFTSPYLTNDTAVDNYFVEKFPNTPSDVIKYITEVLYPATFDGSQPYTDSIGRAALALSELGFTCNANYLDRAFLNQTYSYYFTVPPALHGQDISYTYYTGNTTLTPSLNPLGVQNATVAISMQEWITSFAQLGRPVGPYGTPMFNTYGPNAGIVEINGTNISPATDPAANARCRWWQQALYY
ncbi:acetylcholinesterase precursor [Pseudovirgaria hyperparasitica]|uniref:Carboxylic ester hydrolase n=1 Tax=Pseudovirgaria hyperparasitica TaxID=470096 RepID=A0A6A6W8K7_9PEZI|nr:acetylcholinesterase precursor [Pseudovirgaria hyperparasitica]KAF2758226.1 acetylcholinesterase precursor [Pseudovirgaria hyperparasitica]